MLAIRFSAAVASRPTRSFERFSCIHDSHQARGWSRKRWPRRGSSSAMKLSAAGPRSFVGNFPTGSLAARRFVAINGISKRGSSHSPATSIGSGAPSIRSPSFSIFPDARKRRRLIAAPFATRPCGLDPDCARPARRLPAPISGNQPRRAGAGQLDGAGGNTTALRP
jgi:hypothetical protein